MKKLVVLVVMIFVASTLPQHAFAVYQPTNGEVAFIQKVENQLRSRYKGKAIEGAVSEEIVDFMAKLDEKLEDKTISPRLDWVYGTSKWYLLRIIEKTFPWEVEETNTNSTSSSNTQETPTKVKDDTPQDDEEETTTNTLDRGTEYDGDYRLVDVDARKRTFMPAEVSVPVGEKVKLVIHDVDLTHSVYFPDLQVWKDGNGFYLLDTTQAGEYYYYCAASCGDEYEKMVGVIVIE